MFLNKIKLIVLVLLLCSNYLFSAIIFEDSKYKKYKFKIESINKVNNHLRRSSSNILKGLFKNNEYFKKNKEFIIYLTYDKNKKKNFSFKRARIFIGKYVYNLLYISKYKVYYLTTTNPKDWEINNIFISPNDIYSLNKFSFKIGKPLKKLTITSPFDTKRLHPVLKYLRPHNGIDYRARIGTPVFAVASGKIIFAGNNGSYGKYIKIKHKNSYFTEYAHLSKFYKGRKYLKNRWVKKGQLIGYAGNTGCSTGPHLHFGVKKSKKFINPELLYEFNKKDKKIKSLSKRYNKLKKNRGLLRAIKKVAKKIDKLGF